MGVSRGGGRTTHSRMVQGDGLYRLDPQWRKKGFLATEAVVLNLTISMDPDLLQLGMYIIWLDNLFTKIHLFEEL